MKSILCAALMLAASATTTLAAPAMWLASDADTKVWLFGSIHLMPNEMEWRTEAFEDALAASDLVYFEANVSPEAQGALVGTVLQLGMNFDGTTLTSYLTAEETELLEDVIEPLNLPMVSLQPMKPWLAMTAITAAAIGNDGLDPMSGVDFQMQDEVADSRERYFETAEEQLRIFADLPDDIQKRMLVETLNQVEDTPDMLDKLLGAWENGRPEDMEEYFLPAEGADEDESYNDQLIFDRNARWADSIETLLKGPDDLLVIVGAGHFVGDRSVNSLLEAKGIKVERVQ